MKPENLEPLLLDHALGELSPEVAELLEAHLDRDAAAAQQAAAIRGTLQVARQALDRPVKREPLPPLAMAPETPRLQTSPWRSPLAEWAKLAACVTLGLLLGRALWPGQSGPGPAPARVAAVVPVTAGAPAPEPGFWSLARQAAERGRQADRPQSSGHTYKLHWGSPLKMPLVEENP